MRLISFFYLLHLFSLYTFASTLLSEQFDSFPNYFEYDNEIDGEDVPILSEQFNTEPNYFNEINQRSGYGENPTLFANFNNGIISFITDGSSEDMLQLNYPISSSDTSTGIIYFTVEAGNSASVTDGGTDQWGEAQNQAVAWLEFDDFSDDGEIDGEIALQNHNGIKRITYGNDNYLEVSSIDKIYLRLSYDFRTNLINQFYSTDGENFIQLHSMYAYDIDNNFSITLGAESDYTPFNEGEVYFDNFVIANNPTYSTNSTSPLEVNVSNGVLNVIGGAGPGERGIELIYPVNSAMTDTGKLYFTALVRNAAIVPDGGIFIDSDGDIRPRNEVKCGINFSSFTGGGGVEIHNENGIKFLEHTDDQVPDGDSYLDISNIDNVYLRTSYNFYTGVSTKSYSTDGISFTVLSNEYAPNNDNFSVSLAVETQNIQLEEGDVFFDNFVISDDINYNYNLSNNPFTDNNSGTNTIILKTYKSNDMQTWELIETKEIQSETPLFLKSEIVPE